MDLQLLAALVIGVGLLIGLILLTRFDAFLALVTAAIVTGLIAGVSPVETVGMVTTGFGNTLASIGIVIVLGVMIGKILELSGAADTLAAMFLKVAGKGREDVAMAGTGALLSVPVFCDSAFVIMHAIPRSLSRLSGRSFVGISLAMGAGMVTTHHLVPPTPGPLAVAGLLEVDLGLVILWGGLLALLLLPVAVLYARYMGPRLEHTITEEVRRELARVGTDPDAVLGHSSADGGAEEAVDGAPARKGGGSAGASASSGVEDAIRRPSKRPGRLIASLPLVIPILLIVGNTVSAALSDDGDPHPILGFLGNPVVAILLGLVFALYVLVPREVDRDTASGWLTGSISSAGIILAITGAGGALGNVLRESGVGDAMAEAIGDLPLPAFLIPFLIATLVRLAQGSGTVAMITSGSLTAPLIAGGLDLNPVIAVLAATGGAMFFSYFNDSFFWVVTRFTGLEGTNALKGWSGITTAMWLATGILLGLASIFF